MEFKSMFNKYGIPEEELKEIRARDITCVYCHRVMQDHSGTKGTPGDKATIDHLSNDGPFDKKSTLAICCGRCNSSRGKKELQDWFKTPYCVERNINEETVAEPIKEYIRYIENFLKCCTWRSAKTMPEIPHEYIVRDHLSDDDKKIFNDLVAYI